MLTNSDLEWLFDLWALSFVMIGLVDELLAMRGLGFQTVDWR